LFSWEQATTGFLDSVGLRSIKSKIIVFALLATLIPSVTMGWLSYRNSRRSIDEKIVQELTSLTSHVSREIELWLKKRSYEIRVLSSSYEVSENLETLNRLEDGDPGRVLALGRLADYLGSIGEKFADYEEIFVADVAGKTVATSTLPAGARGLAEGWLARAWGTETIFGHAYWDEPLEAGVMVVAVPVRSATGALLGAMGAKVNFAGLDEILASYVEDPSHELFVVTTDGRVLASSGDLDAPFMTPELAADSAARLFSREMTPHEYQSLRGTEVLGALRTVPEVEWGVLAQKNRAMAYAAILKLRNITLTLLAAVLLIIGLVAHLLGVTIVLPLRRLTRGATKIADGDLDVTLPAFGHSEVGYLTGVFNEMAVRLRKFRDENAAINRALREKNDELRALSITDSLTGLYNRAQLPELLDKELARSRRHRHPFSMLMIDIDHFKQFNDTHGHQAGDEMLMSVSGIIRAFVRASDVAVRYGGEEFLILLTETGPEGALTFAKSLRGKVEEIRWQGQPAVTISIGVASFPHHGNEVEAIIRQADAALYRCKRGGRNQARLAEAPSEGPEQVRA
jgi:diguanylate cyclase (GGDEF)-like protein